jgi:excisionase family DNA binding protein
LCILCFYLIIFDVMRTRFTEVLATAEGEQLLTTGEAAQLLGTSRQHVVDLCSSGDLPFVIAGKHRRVTRHDVEAIQTGTRRLTRDQLRSLWLSHAVASRLVEHPVAVLAQARDNLDRMLASSARGSARVWLRQWQELLDGPIEGILEALTSRSPKSRELRQNSPFAGVLTDEQRRAALHGFTQVVHEQVVR